jgi:hypothetical protein
MFNKHVVFVIGAGASREYEFPLGDDLKNEIAKKVRFRFSNGYGSGKDEGDQELLAQIRSHAPDRDIQNIYTKEANVLAAAINVSISIDEALHYVGKSKHAVDVGKIAIIQSILFAESRSSLGIDPQSGRPKNAGSQEGWILQMLSMALAGSQRENLDEAFSKITFINFNYDRALEHHLYWSLQEMASATPDQAASIVNSLNIIRPYGTIGPLVFPGDTARGGVGFGTGHVDLFSLIGRIRTYTETDALHDTEAMRNALKRARMVLFLGFGYHSSNVDILAIDQTAREMTARNGVTEVIGTFIGVHPANEKVIRDRISQNLWITSENIHLLGLKAAPLLADLRRRILIALE